MMDQLIGWALLGVPAVVFVVGAVLWAGWGKRKLGVSLMGAGVLLLLLVPLIMMPVRTTETSVQRIHASDEAGQ